MLDILQYHVEMKNYDGGICRALYKETKILENKSKHCMPGFDCTRVGFYCCSKD